MSPGEAVFVDDVIENVEASEKLGMQGIYFRDPEFAIRTIEFVTGVGHVSNVTCFFTGDHVSTLDD